MVSYRHFITRIKKFFKPAAITETLSQKALPVSAVHKPVRIGRSDHSISRQHISKSALKVLYQLREAGYRAFLVGGGVRDVLLKRSPKDFDVVTDALPEQVQALFMRHCRLVGKRFLLAHVCFDRKEVVEVATLRSHIDSENKGVIMQEGRILRDNAYGSSVEEDALRRDFTINALYYDINDFSVLDCANGMADLQAGVIRLIGEPVARYHEDPVRMLRAARLTAKLGFTIDPITASPIPELGHLLTTIHASRLYEEMLKLFLTGHAVQSFAQLRHYNLFKYLFGLTEACFDDPVALALVEQALHNTDERIALDRSVIPEFFLAALLWPPLQKLLREQEGDDLTRQSALLTASHRVLTKQAKQVSIPRRVTVGIEEIWVLQLRMTGQKNKRRILSILEHPRFRAGYDFLLLRASVGEPVEEKAAWWTQFVTGDEKTRQALLTDSPVRKRRPRTRRRPAPKINHVQE